MQTRYYFAGLAVAGAVSGVVVPKHLWAHYLGAVLGQAAYECLSSSWVRCLFSVWCSWRAIA